MNDESCALTAHCAIHHLFPPFIQEVRATDLEHLPKMAETSQGLCVVITL